MPLTKGENYLRTLFGFWLGRDGIIHRYGQLYTLVDDQGAREYLLGSMQNHILAERLKLMSNVIESSGRAEIFEIPGDRLQRMEMICKLFKIPRVAVLMYCHAHLLKVLDHTSGPLDDFNAWMEDVG